MNLFDTHCHLTDPQFDADREAVIRRAIDAGVTRMLTLGTDVVSSRAVVALAEQYAPVYAAVGIHPEAVKGASLDDLRIIRELAAHPKVAAIGEIGLDYYWDRSTIDLQQIFFELQLGLAAELGLPVAIHDRDAHDKLIETLEARGRAHGNLPGVLHAFSGDLEMAQRAFALGYAVSFGGPVTYRNNKRAPQLIRELPLERILLETDAPYLTPHPFRGKRNEPAQVRLVAERIAELKKLTVQEIAAQTSQNSYALFRRKSADAESVRR